jgi:GLPGLI family protein
MKRIFFLFVLLAVGISSNAQQFIDKAVIEYEVKTNVKKTMSTNDDSFMEMLKDNMTDFKTAYCTYTFANNKSMYKFDHWDTKTKVLSWFKEGDEENNWYMDFNTGKSTIKKQVQGTDFIINDSIVPIKWKFANESREIAGFNCRKAVGIIMDSVYVFAFYTDEITIPGGPCSINGLPGMILGLTIPRLYTSYIATKVMVNNVSEAGIKPATAKKPYTYASLKSLIDEKTKEWFSWGEDKEENKRQKNMFMWRTFL